MDSGPPPGWRTGRVTLRQGTKHQSGRYTARAAEASVDHTWEGRHRPMNQTPSSMPEMAGELFIAGDLHVDVGQQRVTRAGIKITLPDLSFQLLLALIRVAPNILSNDMLMARVWPGLIVSPETVAKRVNLLREALGDDAKEPRYVAGVRSRGYRLVAVVSPAVRPAPPAKDPMSTPAVVSQPNELSTGDTLPVELRAVTTKTSRMWWFVLPVLLAVIVAIAIGMRAV